jgi:hypothetical protein
MKLKQCSCCKKELTTKNTKKIGRNDLGLWFNCLECHSTILLAKKRGK